MSYPEDYRYAKSHEWLLLEGENATIGITDYAQSSLGDIVFVELPKVGAEMTAVSDLYVPVAGTVTEINEALNDAPDTINTAANDTWIIKLKVTDASAVDGLMDAAAYDKFVAEETGH
jgi:glycine cleavage system H protein